MKMKDEDIRDLVQEVRFDCHDKEGLRKALNYKILQFGKMWEREHPKKRSRLKRLEEEKILIIKNRDDFPTALALVDDVLEAYMAADDMVGLCKEDIERTKKTFKVLQKYAEEHFDGLLFLNSFLESYAGNQSKLQPITRLLGFHLPEIYEEFFSREWKMSRPHGGGKLNGPAIRFAQFILNRMGIEKSPEAIRKARASYLSEVKTKEHCTQEK